jgi:type VI secretion system secreted protein Hcp
MKRLLFSFCAAFIFAVLPTQAAADYLLELDGIPGESTDAQRARAIEIDSFSFGASNAGSATSGGGGAGKVSFSDITFTKRLDKSSPLLYLSCAQGKHIAKATLVLRKSGGGDKPVEYYIVTMSDILVTSIQSGGGGDIPTESFSLNFTKIEFSYSAQKPDGSLEEPVTSGWDIATNTQP